MGKKKGGNKNKNQQQPSGEGGVVSNTSITSNDNDNETADHHHQEEEMPPTTTATTTNENDDNNNDIQQQQEQQQHHEDPASNDNHNDDDNDDVPPPTEQHHQEEEEEAEHQEQEIQQEQQSAVPAVIDVPSPAVAENNDDNSFNNEPVDAVSTTAKLEGEAQQQQDENDNDNTTEEVAVDDPPTDAAAATATITNQQQHQDPEDNNNNSPLAANVVMEQSNDENNAESLSLSTAASNQQQQQQQPRMASTSDFNEVLPQVAEPRPFGKVIGFGKNGTPAFSCGSSSDSEDRTDSTGSIIQPEALTPYGVVTGRQWSDAEYVRRWLLMAKDTMMPQVAKSSDVWFDSSANVQFKHLSNPSSSSGVTKFQNHVAVEAPLTGDILVWENSNSTHDDHAYPLGHVAIVFDVTATTITIGEQGVNKWEAETYSRKLKMTKDEVTKSVSVFEDNNDDSSSRIIGWVRVLAPSLGGQNITEISDRYRHIVSKGTLTRTPFEPDVTLPWLDKSVPWDNFQIQSFSDGCPGATPSVDIVPSGYYTVDYDLWLRARHLAENLHRLMYSTTHRLIMESENSEKGTQTLEKVFGIPRALHPLLRQSLHTPSVTGRFDIGFDAHGNKDNGTEPGALKVFEYNCDSSACLLETMESQEKVAKHYKFDHIGQSGGLPLKNRLEWWWREFARTQYPKLIPAGQTPTRVIHFMVDDDHEERYTALCMMEAARAAKFETKMCVKLIDFRKMENGDIVDLGGNVVQCVWKTWSWDTALTLYQKQQNNNNTNNQNQNHKNLETSSTTSSSSQQVAVPPPTSPGSTNTNTNTSTTTSSTTKVQLTDILFHPRIIVFEPFWKSVCGNKGLLPYLSEADPNNEFLLKAFFDKNEAISKSYVRKPVSGRTGANITVHDETDGNKSANKEDVSTGGKWGEGQFIYQEKLSVTVLDGNYPTLCSWVVGSGFGGMVVREAKHMVTQLESPVAPLRVKREV